MAEVEYLKVNISSLRFMTLYPGKDDGIVKRTIKDMLLVISLLPILFGIMAETIRELRGSRDDIHSLLISILTGMCVSAMYLFIAIFYTKRKDIASLVPRLKKLEEHFIPPNLVEIENNCRLYTKAVYLYIASADILYCLLPFATYRTCQKNKKYAVHLQHVPCGVFTPLWFPFQYIYSPRFELVILYMIYFVYMFSFISVAYFMLNSCVVIHIIGHLRNLKRLLNIAVTSPEKDELFRKCFQYHIAIIEFSEFVDTCFSPLSFSLVSLVSIIFGILEYQIIIEKSYFESFRYVIHFLGWMLILFLLTYTAQKLWTESLSLADEIYDMPWVDLPIPLQKDMLFMLRRSQRPLTLSTGPIGQLNFESFLAILRSAYSLFALLANFK